MMTREQIELLCKNIQVSTGDWKPEESILLKHDAEQRQVIEEARSTAEYWKAEHLAGNEKIEQQAQEIARLREALEVLLEHLEDDCRLDHHGYCQNHFVTIPCVYKQAQQALKEVK